MANRTFTFTKEDEKLIKTLQIRLEAVYGKTSVVQVIRYALLKAANK